MSCVDRLGGSVEPEPGDEVVPGSSFIARRVKRASSRAPCDELMLRLRFTSGGFEQHHYRAGLLDAFLLQDTLYFEDMTRPIPHIYFDFRDRGPTFHIYRLHRTRERRQIGFGTKQNADTSILDLRHGQINNFEEAGRCRENSVWSLSVNCYRETDGKR
jgi:hypothetical protein